jgi:hypothetical protein
VLSVPRRLGEPFDPREALVPPRRDPRHLALSLREAFVAHGEARFAADAPSVNETGTLKDEEVLGDPLSCDGELGGERACGSLAAIEQEIEQAKPHGIPERRP